MQHGLGKKSQKKFNASILLVKRKKYSALPLNGVKYIPNVPYDFYNKFDDFEKGFFSVTIPEGFIIPDLVIYVCAYIHG